MAPRIVREGEHLDVIAYRHGVAADDVWNAAGNKALRAARTGGHLLQPGDLLDLPARKHPEPIDVAIGSETRIRATIPRVSVEIVLAADGKPVAGEPWHIEGRGERESGTTGADGKVAFEVRVTTPRVTLFLERAGQRRDIAVGGLDPDQSLRGVVQRLRNLGFEPGPPTAVMTPTLAASLERFQRAKGLVPTGAVDPDTLAALVEAHGS